MGTTSGYEIAEAAFSDIESFFLSSVNFQINRELNVTSMRGNAAIRGSGKTARVRLSYEFCNYELSALEDYIFVLTIICHELAHYLNFHNEYKDETELDSVALESRADHFGAQILMVLITFGSKTTRLMKQVDAAINPTVITKSIGKSLRLIYDEIYINGNSELYPEPKLRVGISIAGYLSFHHRYFGSLPEGFTVRFLLTVMRGGNLSCLLEGFDENQQENAVEKITSTHAQLQERFPLMILGFKQKFGYFLTSQFDASENDRAKHRMMLEKHVSEFELS